MSLDLVVLESSYVSGWPEKDDERAGVLPAEEVLTARFDTDVHFTAYVADVPRRHTNASLTRPEAGIRMVAAVFDVDGPGHEADDAWWEAQNDKFTALEFRHPGSFIYRTRGGYRIVYRLSSHFSLSLPEHAEHWTRNYLVWCDYLEREFDIVPDRACKGWTRLYRAPHATRDGVQLDLETLGEPSDIGVWTLPPEEYERAPAPETPTEAGTRAPSAGPRESAAAALAAAWPEQGRHTAQLALAGALRRDGWSAEAALEFLCGVCRKAGNEDRQKREATIRATWNKSPDSLPGWPAVGRCVGGAVAEAVRGMLNHDPGFTEFQAVLAPATTPAQDGLGFQYGGWQEEPPPVEYLVDGLIPREAVVILYGRGDSLKTWMTYSMLLAIARGQPWLGRPTRAARAGIVDFETGRNNMRRRLYRLRAEDTQSLGVVSFTKLKPNDPAFWVELEKERLDVVAIDSLRKANPGANENDSGEAIVPLEHAAAFAERTGCAVIWIHHAKKESADGWPEIRGSAAIEDQADCTFAFIKEAESPERMRVTMRCKKPGDMPTPDDVTALVAFDDASHLVTVTQAPAAVKAPEKGQDASDEEIAGHIRLVMRETSYADADAIAKAIHKDQQKVRPIVKRMMAEREITKVRGQGLTLDDDAKRRARILSAIRMYRPTTAGQIAQLASVEVADVTALKLAYVICQSADGTFLVPERDASNGVHAS